MSNDEGPRLVGRRIPELAGGVSLSSAPQAPMEGPAGSKRTAVTPDQALIAIVATLKDLVEINGGQAADIHRIADLMSGEQNDMPHLPGVAPRDDGSWGTFCLGCTQERGDFTYPCLRQADDPTAPPARFMPAPEFIEESPGGTS